MAEARAARRCDRLSDRLSLVIDAEAALAAMTSPVPSPMTPERFEHVREIFHRCCELEAEKRGAYLDEACAEDGALRAEVEALLAEDQASPPPDRATRRAPLGAILRALADPLTPAPAQLGRYRVVGKLGEGGMGVVYRGHDTALGRDVAIKVLPPTFVADPQRALRFEREARLLASLSHPNIAAIHGLEEAEGTRFLVLELVEGPTLAQRLARGPPPIDEALGIARQIAEALEAAHEQGVVHRDLKPGNIKITPDDKVKVLDFGIAKAMEPATSAEDQAEAAARPRDLTFEGMTVGTPGYMSPEQIRSKSVDKRSDVFSFGCIVYECLTGQMCFTGDTPADASAAALERDPDWALLPVRTPPRVRDLLEECLEKDPQRRLHDIADARLTLERAIERREWTTTGAMRAITGGRRPPGLRAALPWAMTALLAIAAAASWLGPWHTGGRVAPGLQATVRTFLTPERPVDEGFGLLALSPDGRLLAYQAGGETGGGLFVQETGGLGAREVAETRGISPLDPFLSPDARWLGFYTIEGNLMKVPIGGGPLTGLAFAGVGYSKGADWFAGGIIYSPLPNSGLVLVPAEGGTPRTLTTPNLAEREVSHRWPQVLPGGRQVLFTLKRSDIATFDEAAIAILDMSSGRWRTLIGGGSYARYVPTGHIVYARAGKLLAVPFDLSRAEVHGSPVTVIDAVKCDPGSGSATFAIASEAGILVYVPGGPVERLHELVWVDRQGRQEPSGAPARNYADLTFAPDGRRVALTVYGATDAVFVYDFEQGALSRVTFEGNCASAMWMPDGERLVFNSDREGSSHAFVAPADGSTPPQPYSELSPRQTVELEGKRGFVSVSPASVVFVPANDGSTDAAPRTIGDVTGLRSASVSPDASWVAYWSSETGRGEVFVRPTAGGAKRQVSRGGGEPPLRWSRATGELFYYGYEDGVGCVCAVSMAAGDGRGGRAPGEPVRLFELPEWKDWSGFAVHPDGQRFLFARPLPPVNKTEQVVAVLNWFDELKAKVPASP